MKIYRLATFRNMSPLLFWFLLFYVIAIISAQPQLSVLLPAGLAAFAVPLILFVVSLASYIQIDNDTLTIVNGFVAKKHIPISSIKRIYPWKVFKIGAVTSLAIEFGDSEDKKTVPITGVFTSEHAF
jgi:hypothetical protein